MFLEFFEDFRIFIYMYVLNDFYLRWLSRVFFGARSMGTNGASAQVFKRKEKTKTNRTFASRVPLTAILFVPNKCSSKNA